MAAHKTASPTNRFFMVFNYFGSVSPVVPLLGLGIRQFKGQFCFPFR